jgi:hypothetical protein
MAEIAVLVENAEAFIFKRTGYRLIERGGKNSTSPADTGFDIDPNSVSK